MEPVAPRISRRFILRPMMAAPGNPPLSPRHYRGMAADRRRLVTAARSGDRAAFAALVERHQPALLRACRGLAPDAAQEARAASRSRGLAGLRDDERVRPVAVRDRAQPAPARDAAHAGAAPARGDPGAGRPARPTPLRRARARRDRRAAARPARRRRPLLPRRPLARPDRRAPRDLRRRRQDPPAQGPRRAAGPPRRPPKGAPAMPTTVPMRVADVRDTARRPAPQSSCSRSTAARAACRSGSAPPRRPRSPRACTTSRRPRPGTYRFAADLLAAAGCGPRRRSASSGSPTTIFYAEAVLADGSVGRRAAQRRAQPRARDRRADPRRRGRARAGRRGRARDRRGAGAPPSARARRATRARSPTRSGPRAASGRARARTTARRSPPTRRRSRSTPARRRTAGR